MKKLQSVKEEVKKWNKSVFGDIRLKKMAIMGQIEEIDKKEMTGSLDSQNRALRCNLKANLEEIITKEEVSWNQKARVKGVKEWDNNSKLFHRIASGRKANNMVNKIESLTGSVLQTEDEVEKEIVDFFEQLYTQNIGSGYGIEGIDWAEIDEVSKTQLERPFEEEEIKSALFSCDRNKAPGPDGFTMAALQDGWETIKEDVLVVFNEFFENGVVNARTNATYICLIPKKLKSISIKDFRPISLVTSLYKLVAKVLSLRLKAVLDSTIDSAQSAFVQGRQILDLVLIANEAVEEYRAKKKEGLVFKVDFEKAFDHIRWDFLDFVLQKKGFGSRWRSWIMGCLYTTNFSVIVNGRPRGHFGASRGLRQGDPMSPFLFILVGDVLSRLMKRACDLSLLEGFEIGTNKVRLSHLQFADDSIFFLPKKEVSINNLVNVLKVFSLISGLKINMAKSVVAGININEDDIRSIARRLGCSDGSWPMNYLGLPLGGNPRSLTFWNPVIEKVSKRLDGWHKGHLSKGGRLVLLQSVLGSIPTYFMSLFKMSVQVSLIIEKLMRNFIWEGKGEGRKDHLVSWDIVTKPKSQGGLGVGNLLKRNIALLGKWLWRFPLECNALWHSIIASRHGLHSSGLLIKSDPKTTLKSPWRSIANIWDQFVNNTKLVVGCGDKINFWEDVWVEDTALKQIFPRLYRLSLNQNSVIQSVIKWDSASGHSWDLQFSRNLRDREFSNFTNLLGIIDGYHYNRLGMDKRIWVGDISGEFTCKSFMDLLSRSNQGSSFHHHNFLWKNGVPHKIKVFNWLAIRGRINTNDLLQSKRPHFSISPSWCVLCKESDESANHILLHCKFSRQVWAEIMSCFGLSGPFPHTWAEFTLIKWYFKGNSAVFSKLWRFLLHATSWLLWLERNKRIFEEKQSCAKDVWKSVYNMIGLWAKAIKLFDSVDSFLFSLDPNSFLLDT